jgi:hypothetical protein
MAGPRFTLCLTGRRPTSPGTYQPNPSHQLTWFSEKAINRFNCDDSRDYRFTILSNLRINVDESDARAFSLWTLEYKTSDCLHP